MLMCVFIKEGLEFSRNRPRLPNLTEVICFFVEAGIYSCVPCSDTDSRAGLKQCRDSGKRKCPEENFASAQYSVKKLPWPIKYMQESSFIPFYLTLQCKRSNCSYVNLAIVKIEDVTIPKTGCHENLRSCFIAGL